MGSRRILISACLVAVLATTVWTGFPDCMNQAQQISRTRFSGVVPNELGFYDSCISKKDMRYMTLMWYNNEKSKTEIYWGHCVGIDCTEADVAAYYQKNFPLKPLYTVVAKDPNVKENQWAFTTGAWVFVMIMGCLTLLAITGTVIHQQKTTKERLKKLMTTRSTIKNVQDLQVPGMASVLTMNPGATVMNPAATVMQREPTLLGDKAKDDLAKKEVKPFWALFDIVTNVKSLVYPRIVNPSVQVFDLLRVKAMIWVVLGHELAYRLTVSENFTDAGFFDYTKGSWYFTYNQTAFYAVDIFLFMGGYVAIVSLNKFIANFAPFSFGKWYKIPVVFIFCVFKRYMRIMPAYAVLLCFWYYVAPYMIHGPIAQGTIAYWPCNFTNFWQSFILGWKVDITSNSMCVGWAWYLALDFQIFMTMPVILIISNSFGKRYSKMIGMGICSTLAVASVIYTYISCLHNEVYYLNPFDMKQTLNTYYYVSTPQRCVIYYIGCLFAYMSMKSEKKKPKEGAGVAPEAPEKPKEDLQADLLKEEKRKERKRKAIVKMQMIYFAIGTAVTVAVTCVLHYIFQWGRKVMDISLFWNATFIAFGKIFFILGFMTMLLIIGFRFRGFGKYIAENRLLQLIANLSFTMYLFHFTMIQIRAYSLKSIPTYLGLDLFSAGLAEITFTLIIALYVALVVEIPAMHIWRVWLEGPILHLVKKL